jgi:Cu(I)/Ag(I) efflux system membrane fusion protein
MSSERDAEVPSSTASEPPTDDHREPEMIEGEEPPPRGVKAMAAVRWALLAVTALFALFAWTSYARAQKSEGANGSRDATVYHCPMHPQIVSNERGECPICHMQLEPVTMHRGVPPASASASASAPVPVPASSRSTSNAGAHPIENKPRPPGTAPITLSLDRIQAIGVRTALVEETDSSQKLRVTAVVEPAEQGFAEVHVRSAGFVEKIMVNQTGVAVAAGQPLFALYSPEIFQAESELTVVSGWAHGEGGASTAEAARRKLELLGMSPGEIDAVAQSRQPSRTITVRAPAGGYVVKKSIVLGSHVVPETALYEIQDLSRVYVVADVFQRDIGDLRAGETGTFVPTLRPDAAVQTRVDLVYPALNAEARTTRVRMVVHNPKEAPFRPGDYGVVEFAGPGRRLLSVPKDAVIDTGLSTYVFVVEGEGQFVPTGVVLGPEEGPRTAIAEGLHAGQRVVSGATFLIDSESRLQASAAAQAIRAPQSGEPMPSGPQR